MMNTLFYTHTRKSKLDHKIYLNLSTYHVVKQQEPVQVPIFLKKNPRTTCKGKKACLKQSNTLASCPNSFLKIPIEPGPQTSWVIKISTLTQTFSPGINWGFSEALAKIFSVIVNAVLTYKFTMRKTITMVTHQIKYWKNEKDSN